MRRVTIDGPVSVGIDGRCGKGRNSWPEPAPEDYGQSTAALPQYFRRLGDLKRVVDLNAEVAHGAFDPMASGP